MSLDPTSRRQMFGRYDRAFHPSGPLEPLGQRDGFSGANLHRFDSGRGGLVLRGWPRDGPNRVGVERIHGWMSRAAETLPFVPTPIADETGATAQEIGGRVWDLTPWKEGASVVERPWTEAETSAGFAALAEFHDRFWREGRGESPGVSARMGDLDRWVGGDLDAVVQRLAPVGSDVVSDLARVWIDQVRLGAASLHLQLRAAHAARPSLQLCLRDARPEHFLFQAERITGLVDYGAMGVDTVAGDLARLLGDRRAGCRPTTEVGLSAYRSVRPLNSEEVGLVVVFEAANRLLAPGRWIRWHILERRRFAELSTVETRLRQLLDRIRS